MQTLLSFIAGSFAGTAIVVTAYYAVQEFMSPEGLGSLWFYPAGLWLVSATAFLFLVVTT